MKAVHSSRSALSCIVAAMLSACGGSQPPIGAPGAMPQSRAIATHADGSGSWMLPGAKNSALLYVSNVSTVTVYSYPKGRHVGTLTGFYRPVGECSDAAGNVFIANSNAVLEYSHGGKKPIARLTLSGYTPEGCGVNPVSGALAVTWYQSESSPNYVGVYANPSGTPQLYTLDNASFVFCGYDAKGTLFADGFYGGASSDFFLAELSKGGSKLQPMTVDQTFEHPGAVQWDGKNLAVGDDEAQKVYRFAISGSTATLKGTVTLGGAETVYQVWIDGNRLVGADGVPDTVRYWTYPAGGSPTKSITEDVEAPYGVTIGLAPSH